MNLEILKNKKIFVSRRLKNLIFYVSRKRGARKSWKKRHAKVLAKNSSYKSKCDKKTEKLHRQIWAPFRSSIDLTTLRISKNISGVSDPRVIPEDIYTADIEPTLISDKAVDYIGIKSFYNRWFSEGIFPEDYLHRIDGQLYDNALNKISYKEFVDIIQNLSYPVIVKPIKDTYGGTGICFASNDKEILKYAEKEKDFIVQKKIKQHEFFKKFHPESLNTVKVFVYRSVSDNKLHILSMALRMGKSGSLDNEASGGINTYVTQDGILNGYAIDKFGSIYKEHPDTKVKFDSRLPDFELLKNLSKKVAGKVFYTRIMGLDACYDLEGKWRIIEINTYAQSIRFSQFGGQPFFGEFTKEVIKYCKKNHWALKE